MKRSRLKRSRKRLKPRQKPITAEYEENRRIVLARGRCVAQGLPGAGECFGELTVDHIKSLARGGTHALSNLQALCLFHNGYKEDEPDWAYGLGLAKHSWD